MQTKIHDDPFVMFQQWFEAAKSDGSFDATAMALATATLNGKPSVRIVLLKAFDQRGFVFYTNLESCKGKELKENSQVALCFYWPKLEVQIRIEGEVEAVTAAEADLYYASRPRGSQIGAWASQQSRPLQSPAELYQHVKTLTAEYADKNIPRPEYWSGFRVVPNRIEFWQSGEFRLHERVSFNKNAAGKWQGEYLYP